MLGVSMISLQPIIKLHYSAVYKFGMMWVSAIVLYYSTVHISYFNNITVIQLKIKKYNIDL